MLSRRLGLVLSVARLVSNSLANLPKSSLTPNIFKSFCTFRALFLHNLILLHIFAAVMISYFYYFSFFMYETYLEADTSCVGLFLLKLYYFCQIFCQ